MKQNRWQIIIVIFGLFFASCNKKNEVWYCPMHPDYHSDHSGTCPICGMDLVKQESHEEKMQRENDENSFEDSFKEKILKEDNDGIYLDDTKQALIGIKTTTVVKRVLEKNISTSGRVAYDPDLYTAIVEYRDALKRSTESLDEEKVLNASFVASTKSRLKQLGLSNSQIKEWGNTRKDPLILITGGNSGQAYIYSQAFEADIGDIHAGLPVKVFVNAFPDKVFYGRVRGVDTILDSKNRTLRIRSEVSDPGNLLKPQMFADVNIVLRLGNVLAVPKAAVMDTGTRKVVYVKLSGSRFIAREVKTGNSTDDFFEIKHGLKKGEEVVVGANFLLDSESKLKTGTGHSH